MKTFVHRQKWVWVSLLFLAILVALPLTFKSGFLTNTLINVVRWTIFALAFDLVAGHIGAVSLGQPIFYGIGAYLTAFLGPKLGMGWLGCMLVAAVLMALLALLTGVAFFRIRDVTFAVRGNSWFVLSGYYRRAGDESDDLIFYAKFMFSPDRSRFAGFEASYPEADRKRWEPIIEAMEDSFRAPD